MFSFFFFWAIWNGYSIVRLSLTCQTDLDKPWLDYPQQPRRNKFIYLFLYFVSLLIPTFIRFYFVPICAVSNQCVKHIYFFFENMNRNKRSKSRAVLQIYNWLCTDHKRKYFFPLFDFQDYFDDISFFFLPASWRSDEKKKLPLNLIRPENEVIKREVPLDHNNEIYLVNYISNAKRDFLDKSMKNNNRSKTFRNFLA